MIVTSAKDKKTKLSSSSLSVYLPIDKNSNLSISNNLGGYQTNNTFETNKQKNTFYMGELINNSY